MPPPTTRLGYLEFANMLIVGAALWAADIEANKSLVERAIELRETTQAGRG